MADSTFTQTGRDELKAGIERFPALVTARLRSVAQATAIRVQARARALLQSQLKTGATALADGIAVIEDAANKQFLVVSSPPKGQPANVTIWNEHGTIKMSARPYMRPAALGEDHQYRTEMEAAALAAAQECFGN